MYDRYQLMSKSCVVIDNIAFIQDDACLNYLAGEGNTSASAEFNFRCDPEAADIILSEARCEVTIIPWETCNDPQHCWPWVYISSAHHFHRHNTLFFNLLNVLPDANSKTIFIIIYYKYIYTRYVQKVSDLNFPCVNK